MLSAFLVVLYFFLFVLSIIFPVILKTRFSFRVFHSHVVWYVTSKKKKMEEESQKLCNLHLLLLVERVGSIQR